MPKKTVCTDMDLIPDDSPSPDVIAETDKDSRLAWRLLNTFSVKTAAVYLLYEVHKVTHDEIASDCGISVSTVRRLAAQGAQFYRLMFGGGVESEVVQ